MYLLNCVVAITRNHLDISNISVAFAAFTTLKKVRNCTTLQHPDKVNLLRFRLGGEAKSQETQSKV